MVARKDDIQFRKKALAKWAEALGIEVTPELERLTQYYDLVDLVRPLVIADLERNLSPALLADRYGLKESKIRYIGIRAGIFKNHPNIRKAFPGVNLNT